MIYVEMLGRTGNQMFSYSFARWLQLKNKRQKKEKIAFDFSNSQFNSVDNNIHELNDYVCNNNIVVAKRKLHPLQRLVLKIFFYGINKNVHSNSEREKYEEKFQGVLNFFGIYMCSFNFHKFSPSNIFKNNLVLGWYESSEFFDEIDDVISKDFMLDVKVISELSEETKAIISEIEGYEQSVCLNVRRGDFYSDSNIGFCAVCDKIYYETAANIISEIIDSPHFFVFSDDIEWARSNLVLPDDTVYIDNSQLGLVPSTQIHIMTKCRNYIISNSTYSWWAQHLGTLRNGGVSLLHLVDGETLTKKQMRRFMKKTGY